MRKRTTWAMVSLSLVGLSSLAGLAFGMPKVAAVLIFIAGMLLAYATWRFMDALPKIKSDAMQLRRLRIPNTAIDLSVGLLAFFFIFLCSVSALLLMALGFHVWCTGYDPPERTPLCDDERTERHSRVVIEKSSAVLLEMGVLDCTVYGGANQFDVDLPLAESAYQDGDFALARALLRNYIPRMRASCRPNENAYFANLIHIYKKCVLQTPELTEEQLNIIYLRKKKPKPAYELI